METIRLACNQCTGSEFIDTNEGIVCALCGLVKNDIIFSSDLPFNENVESGDYLGYTDFDALAAHSGEILYPGAPKYIVPEPTQKKNRRQAGVTLDELGSRLRLPQAIVNTAKEGEKLYNIKKMRNVKQEALLLALLYNATKQHRITGGYTIKKFSQQTGIPEHDIKGYYKDIISHHKNITSGNITISEQQDDLLTNYITILGVSGQNAIDMRETHTRIKPKMEGKKPSTIAAVSVYSVMKRKRLTHPSIEDLVAISGISKRTIQDTEKTV